jgi:hypothetical protein
MLRRFFVSCDLWKGGRTLAVKIIKAAVVQPDQ